MDWRQTAIAADGTHHLAGGRALYGARFDQVLKFHSPGLAPVRDASGAFHIDVTGQAAYPARYRNTFGFYEGLAVVDDDGEWFHIQPDGEPAYADRFAWCGNYQGRRCAVRLDDGRYLHLDPQGRPVYENRWSYAGDFRDGIAVVQRDDGMHSHVDQVGHPIHGEWFVDLDVFHKGFARARDGQGWCHVDENGRPVYPRRFAMVEPFYNGQARVERHDGGIEVIGEDGRAILELRPARRSEFAELSGDMVGFWRTQCVGAAVELGVFDHLPAGTRQIADECRIHPDLVGRLLRALGEIGLVERCDAKWSATKRGEYLATDHGWTLADAAPEYARHMGRLWEQLPAALRGGDGWKAQDIFGQVATDPTRLRGHHRMLRSYARHDYGAVPEALGLRGDETVIDAGGGLGVIAEGILARYPDTHVVLLERPEVVEQVQLPSGLAGKLDPRHVDLLAPWPRSADAVVLARVLHDWDDEHAARILSNARGALQPGGRLYIVEMLLHEGSFAGGLCDLHLLMATGGRERTREEFAALMEAAGFDLLEVRSLPALPSVIVGVAR